MQAIRDLTNVRHAFVRRLYVSEMKDCVIALKAEGWLWFKDFFGLIPIWLSDYSKSSYTVYEENIIHHPGKVLALTLWNMLCCII